MSNGPLPNRNGVRRRTCYYLITNAANLNGTGRPDLFARDPAGRLWLYPLSGNAVFGKRSLVTGNLTGLTLILGPGDVSGDRCADLVTRENSGRLRLYRGDPLRDADAGYRPTCRCVSVVVRLTARSA